MRRTHIEKFRNFTLNPFEVLGEPRDAEDASLEQAFTALRRGDRVSEYSLKEIEEAYLLVKDARSRTLYRLLCPKPLSSLEELEALLRPRPKYIGPGIWMKAITELSEKPEKGDPHERSTGQIPVRRDSESTLWDQNFRSHQRN